MYNEQKIQDFIKRGQSLGKSRDEIKKAYEQALADGVFNLDTPNEKPGALKLLKESAISSLPNPVEIGKGIYEIGETVVKGTQKLGEDIARVKYGVTDQYEDEEMGLLGRSVKRFGESSQEKKEGAEAYVKGEQTAKRTILQNMGLNAGATSDVIGDTFISFLKTLAPKELEEATKDIIQEAGTNTKVGKAVLDKANEIETKYNQLKEIDSNIARDYKAQFGGIMFAADALGFGAIQKTAKGGLEVGKSTIQAGKETIQKAPKIIESGPVIKAQDFIKQQLKEQELLKKSKEKISDIGESIETRTEALKTGIPKEKIAGLQANPLQADEYTKLTQRLNSPEGIADIKDYKTERIGAVTQELTSKIDEIRAAKGETSNVYKDIRALPVQVKTDDLFNNLKTSLEKNGMKFDDDGNLMRVPGSQAKDLNASDIAKFQQLYNDIRADAQKGYLTPNEMLTFRKTASDLAKYDGSTTTTGQGIMRAIRKDLDNVAKEQIPGLKELDSQFVDKLDELENAIRDLVYKQGDVKGEWRSNIVNIIGTLDRQNRAKLLERLEEVMPGIGERIKAIDNLPSIYQAINNKGMLEKFTGVGGAFAGSATLGAAVPGLGHVVGFVLGYVGGEMLENVITGARRVAINKVLSKISPEGFKKMKEIDLKIQNNEALRKTDKDFIDNLKLKLENETNNIEAGKTKDIDNSMGDNMTSNTDELLTSRMADSSTNNIKSVKARL